MRLLLNYERGAMVRVMKKTKNGEKIKANMMEQRKRKERWREKERETRVRRKAKYFYILSNIICTIGFCTWNHPFRRFVGYKCQNWRCIHNATYSLKTIRSVGMHYTYQKRKSRTNNSKVASENAEALILVRLSLWCQCDTHTDTNIHGNKLW